MEVVTPFVVAPWWEPPEVQIAQSKEEALKYHDITILCSPPDTIFIYTDGSGLEDRVGAAAVNYNPRLDENQPHYKEHCLRKASKACLGTLQNSTVFAGELKGIDMALDMPLWTEHTGNIVIFTDNQATLQQVADPKWCSGQMYLDSIIEKLDCWRSLGTTVKLCWVPAHKGVPGNELADTAAKAAGLQTPEDNQPILRSSVCTKIKELAMKHWEQAWEAAPHGRVTYLLEPIPHKSVLQKHSVLSKPESSVLIQTHTGKIALNAYLYSIGRAEHPYCQYCPLTRETVHHVLMECPEYEGLRANIFGNHNFYDKKKLLGNCKTAKQVVNFMLQTQVLGQFKALKTGPELDL